MKYAREDSNPQPSVPKCEDVFRLSFDYPSCLVKAGLFAALVKRNGPSIPERWVHIFNIVPTSRPSMEPEPM